MASIEDTYTKYFKPIFSRVGVHEFIQEIYWKGKIRIHPGAVTHRINGTTASFQITSKKEYERFYDLKSERSQIKNILSETCSDDVVFDIGANVGMYTCFLAKQVTTGEVIGFEPHPTNIDALQANLDRNDLDAMVIKKALSDTSGSTELSVASEMAGEGTHSLAVGNEPQTIEIEQATGDELVTSGDLPVPSILKIDVEGAEQRVLEGLEATLARSECRTCYVEIHPDRLQQFGGSEAELRSLLERCGFTVTDLKQRRRERFVKATK